MSMHLGSDERGWLLLMRAGDALPMTCLTDQREHAIAESMLVHGRARGRYKAVCGHLVVPMSLCAPPGVACSACAAELNAEQESRARRARWAGGGARHRGHSAARWAGELLRAGRRRRNG